MAFDAGNDSGFTLADVECALDAGEPTALEAAADAFTRVLDALCKVRADLPAAATSLTDGHGAWTGPAARGFASHADGFVAQIDAAVHALASYPRALTDAARALTTAQERLRQVKVDLHPASGPSPGTRPVDIEARKIMSGLAVAYRGVAARLHPLADGARSAEDRGDGHRTGDDCCGHRAGGCGSGCEGSVDDRSHDCSGEDPAGRRPAADPTVAATSPGGARTNLVDVALGNPDASTVGRVPGSDDPGTVLTSLSGPAAGTAGPPTELTALGRQSAPGVVGYPLSGPFGRDAGGAHPLPPPVLATGVGRDDRSEWETWLVGDESWTDGAAGAIGRPVAANADGKGR
jgi:uncharacterized protein YukE